MWAFTLKIYQLSTNCTGELRRSIPYEICVRIIIERLLGEHKLALYRFIQLKVPSSRSAISEIIAKTYLNERA